MTEGAPAFAELCVTTNFSFLRGGSHPGEIVEQAAALGLAGIAITDRNSLAGVVRGHLMAKEHGLQFVVGCRLVFRDGTPDVLAWPADMAAYGRLCRLLSTGNLRAEKGTCLLDRTDLMEWGAGLLMGVIPPADLADPALADTLRALERACPGAVHLMASLTHGGEDHRRMALTERVARAAGVPMVATNDVLYHAPERRPLQDVLTCIREKTKLAAAGYRLQANAERHLKPPAEMARLFRRFPEALEAGMALLSRITFSLDELAFLYPEEATGHGETAQETLARLAEEGAQKRYDSAVPAKVRANMRHELGLIGKLKYAPYFLTVYDIMEFARSKGILCQGRGSAANSTVCYCLHITEVNPMSESAGLFERFVSEEREEPPDIDVDFEHERREEVMQFIYQRYGRDRTALAATVITYRSRSAVREVGKVFGLSDDVIGALSGSIWGWSVERVPDRDVRRAGLDPEEAVIRQVLDLAKQITGFPRHLSQHVGGFVISRDRLDEMVPVMNAAMENRTTVEWDKDDLDALRMLKVDVLALGMLSCIRRAFEFMKEHYGQQLSIAGIRAGEDAAVYGMLQRADSIGVFQVESRAQMSMLPRLKPEKFYDLVIEVAIVRPGPIQGGMVHPYLRRKQGIEKENYPSPALENILKRTLGVPLFQEQAMQIAIDGAGFSPGEADKLRRSMATFRRLGTINKLKERFISGMRRNGYDEDFAERCFSQIEGFGDYGFPESHAASFAILVYVSAWLKCHYPDVFCAAILNSQPMGFYAPSQLVRDAERHGVIVLPPDVNHSNWLATLEPLPDDAAPFTRRLHATHRAMQGDIRSRLAVRLGLRQVKGFREADAEAIMHHRRNGYDSVRDLWLRTGMERTAIERLADADAFRSIGLDRRDALWAARGESAARAHERLPLFDVAGQDDIRREPDFALPPMPPGEHVVNDYRYLSLSLKAHPLSFLRGQLAALGIMTSDRLREAANGRRVTVAGLVIIRQRPGTAKGTIFMTMEDETDIANAIVWPKVFEAYRPVVLGARLAAITGRVQKASDVIHVVAERVDDLSHMLGTLAGDTRSVPTPARADEVTNPGSDHRSKPRRQRTARAEGAMPLLDEPSKAANAVMPKGRNFH